MPSRLFAPGLLDGQVVVVTGGGSELGRASALELAACGATVVVAGEGGEPLEETARLCEGGRCEAVACDVREEEQAGSLAGTVLDRHGRIDTLVNGDDGDDMLEGTWLMTQAAANRAMIPAGGGKVVNVAPPPQEGMPGAAAARAAVENLTRVLSIEWSRFNIRLTALGAGSPEVHAWLVAYLASPAGDYYSGCLITPDAGGVSGLRDTGI